MVGTLHQKGNSFLKYGSCDTHGSHNHFPMLLPKLTDTASYSNRQKHLTLLLQPLFGEGVAM